MYKTTLLILALGSFLVLSESKPSGVANNATSDLAKFLKLATALKYGDACSWEAEELRQNYTKLTMDSLKAAVEMIKVFVEKEYKLCSALQLYVCDKETQKCVCGEAGMEALLGIDRSLFTLEGGDKCRWEAKSACLPEDFLDSNGLTIVDSKCKSGTICKTGEGKVCTETELMNYFSSKFSNEYDMERVTKILYSGEVCACNKE